MRFAFWLCTGLGAASLVVWIGYFPITGDKSNPPWSIIAADWWTAALLLSTLGFGLTVLVLRILITVRGRNAAQSLQAAPGGTPPIRKSSLTGGISLTVPGFTPGHLMDAILNIKTHEHRVRWRANHQQVGLLRPSGSGFNVEHDLDGYVGWVDDVRQGIAMLEEYEATAFRLFPGVGKDWLIVPIHNGPHLVRHLFVYDGSGHPMQPALYTVGAEIDNQSAGYSVGELAPGDLFEVHWSEGPREYSTNVKIVSGQQEYILRRENTGH